MNVTEGLLRSLGEVDEIRMCDENVAAVSVRPGAEPLAARWPPTGTS